MNALSRKFSSVLAVTAITATMALASPVAAGVQTFGKSYSVIATVKGGKNLTILLISGSGRLLASKKVTGTNQKITLKSPATASIGGSTLQLVSGKDAGAKGRYYGPVVLGNKGSTAAKSSIVYTKLKSTAATSIKLGTVTVKTVSGTTQQGYAVTSTKSSAADTSVSAQVRASKGRPLGVGTYGKTAGVSIRSYGVSKTAAGAPCAPVKTPTCDESGHEIAPGSAPPNGQSGPNTSVNKDQTLGGDLDDDGIPNAFDVNDDGDGSVDSADSDTPSPKVAVDGASSCTTIDFRIFTNFKATERDFVSTINAYGNAGTQFEATPARSGAVIGSTMTMVFQPITSVCGSSVTATYLKGNGVAYAPLNYEKLPATCQATKDYQWEIGTGRMCPTQAGNASGFSFGKPFTFAGNNLPSGQDTFTMKVETTDGKSYEFTSSPGFVFVTHPMLVNFDNGAGATGTIPYGQTNMAPIPVTSNTALTLTLYRPQRLAFDGEAGFAEGAYYDLAGFSYSPDLPNQIRTTLDPSGPSGNASNAGPGKCDALKVADSELSNDSRVNTSTKPVLTLKWKIKECFKTSLTWPSAGGYLDVDIQVLPTGPGGNSAQKLFLQLLPGS